MNGKKILKKILIVSSLLTLFPLLAQAGYGTLTWDANTESDLAGYRVYYGTTARTGTTPPAGYAFGPVEVGKVTTFNTPNLNGGTKYYFSIAAYDNSGNVSSFSSEVTKTILAGDINNDKSVNIFDFNEFIGSFNNAECNNRANIVGFGPSSCRVDIFDYNLLLTDFGKTSA
jgi:hypothetical protein